MKAKILIVAVLLTFSQTVWPQGATGSSSTAQILGYASSGVALGVGYVMTKSCGVPGGQLTCLMGVMSIAQGISTAASALGDKGTSGMTADCSDPALCNFVNTAGSGSAPGAGGPSGAAGVNTTGSTPPGGGFGNLPPAIQQAVNQLNQQGYSINPGASTVTTPTGTYPMSAFSSGANLAAIGAITPDQAAALDQAIKNALDQYKVSTMAIANKGGAGGGVIIQKDAKGKPIVPQKPAMVINDPRRNGMKRMLASGETIGAQTDDIFRMITSRYQQRKLAKQFED